MLGVPKAMGQSPYEDQPYLFMLFSNEKKLTLFGLPSPAPDDKPSDAGTKEE
jgi:hypothetical protein